MRDNRGMTGTPDFWIDGHLDLAYLVQHGIDLRKPSDQPERFGVNLPALRAGGVKLALGTIFTECGSQDPWGYSRGDDGIEAEQAGERQLRIYESLEAEGAIRIVRTRGDLENLHEPGPVRVVILMECADPIRTPGHAAWWFERGVRVVGMAWAHGSRYCGGNMLEGPLNALGRELVQAFDALGVLHDASHLSRQSFDDLMQATDRCVVASHSNCASITADVPRHLTDAQIRAIAARGGLCGLNLFGKFLAKDRPATLDDAVRHVLHVRELAGDGAIALGSDFDGGFTPLDCPVGAQRPEELPQLDAALERAGVRGSALAGFRSGNWLRVLRKSLPG
jgi:membrane dipeptidase